VTDYGPIEEAASRWVADLSARGMSAIVTGRLANGLRAEIRSGSSSCRVNLFLSVRRGFSVIYSGGDKSLAEAAAISADGTQDCVEGLSAGMDEAGKGDYFGPLVAAAVCLDPSRAAELRRLGVVDSKLLDDRRIAVLARIVRERAAGFRVEALDPADYNDAFDAERISGRNSLDILASLHGRALGELVRRLGAPARTILDRFCRPERIEPYLPSGVLVEMRTGAESFTPVAAASILARDEYSRRLADLGRALGVNLPAGSSAAADEAGRRLVRRHGEGVLKLCAKVHFRNTGRILTSPAGS